MSDSFSDTSSEVEGADTDSGPHSGSDTLIETDTAPSTLIETVTRDARRRRHRLVSGAESDSLSEATGDTTTETDHPTETVTDSVSDVTMTLTETKRPQTRTTNRTKTGPARPWAQRDDLRRVGLLHGQHAGYIRVCVERLWA